MFLWRQLTRGIRALFNRSAADRDIADEVQQYLDEATASFESAGLSPDDARRAAQRELGNTTAVREQVRGYGWENVIETTVADLSFGFRRLRSRPAFTAVGAITLALGIGASTAIFSAVNPILFESLPYPEAERLTMIWDGSRNNLTFGTYREVIQRSQLFESAAVVRPLKVTLAGPDEPERIDGQYVSANYFRVLGVVPALGRDFQVSEDQPNRPFVVLISDGLWRRRFGGDRSIIGRQIKIQDIPVTVIGVLPNGFENVLNPSAEIWATLQYDNSLPLNGREWGHNLHMVGRLRRGIQLDQAALELATISKTTLAEFPRPQWASLPEGLTASSLQDDLARDVKPALFAIMGAVLLLLTIACVNVTNLLLARGAERRTELALRTALGASRIRLFRQLLAETLLLSVFGGVLGIALAYVAIDAVVALSPPQLPRTSAIAVDSTALMFAFGLTVLVGLVIGVVPAVSPGNGDRGGGIRLGSMRVAGGPQVTRRILVVAQVALAIVLLVNAGLLVRSVRSLFALSPGFNASNLLTMEVQTAGSRFRNPQTTHQFFARALEAVRQVPGVSVAAFTNHLPLTGDPETWGVQLESSAAANRNADPSAYRYAVSPGYFEAMGIKVRDGRALNAQDGEGVPPVAVVSESFAKRRLAGLNPIGQHLRIGPPTGPWFTVVGMVADVKETSLDAGSADAVYVPAVQWQQFADNARWLVVRAQQDPAALASAIRSAIWSIDKNQPILHVATMQERLTATESARRFAMILFEAFGAVALILAAIGTYSLLAGNVTARIREIGVRSAIGASSSSILALVIRQGMILTAIGLVIGTAGALFASRTVVSMLFGVSQFDTVTYAVVITLLAIVSVIACGVPAWRATRIRPSLALKCE